MRKLLALLTCGLCISFTNVSTAQTAKPAAPSAVAEQAARDEIIRRQEAQIASRRLIDQAQKSYSEGNYQDAVTKLEEAVKLLPRAKITAGDRSHGLHLLTDSCYRLADAALRANDKEKARAYAEKALEYDPQNRPAEGIIVKIKQAEAAAPGTTAELAEIAPDKAPEFLAKKDQIKRLFREGKILMSSGQYDEAESRFQQILILDPYNEDASTLLKSLSTTKANIAATAGETTRTRRLEEVTDAWVPAVSRELQRPKPEMPTGVIGREAARQAEILKKLNDIIIPEINYREAVVSDVITFLSEESRRLDPDKAGVNIVLGSGVSEPTAAAPAAPAPGGATEGQPAAAAGEGAEGRKITLSLRNVPLVDALKYVTTLADLKYRVESSAVIVLPTNAPSGDMITRSYPVNPGVFVPLFAITNRPAPTQQTVSTGGGGGNASQAAPLTQAGPSFALPDTAIAVDSSNQVRQAFINAGVEFPPGSAFLFYERTSTIIIRNTPENLDAFDRVLAVLNAVPTQVEIEAKFIEISQNDLDELAFQWNVGQKSSGSFVVNGGTPPTDFDTGVVNPSYSSSISGGLRDAAAIQGNAIDSLLAANGFGTSGSLNDTLATVRGILTNPQFQLVVQALSQKKSADILNAPKVTTISGAQAQLRVAQEFIYPTTYTPATVVAGSSSGTGGVATEPAVTPSTPSAFASRPVGVVFNVTPMVGADGYTINLTLIPQVTDFLGFIEYGNTITIGTPTGVASTFNSIKQPLFSTRDIMTSVEIWDGQTVVLGGLIREDVQKVDDKIPFLGDLPAIGRLFRSKVTQRTKRNLLIFVTARLIDPAGNPVHRTETASLR
ncbi:MAG TPA: tetratricopeptide repeat protein [Verrucomicrobiae bacterium]|nr:tetratricopeptide repeat protein [Verrucomicrobiae bacterium]